LSFKNFSKPKKQDFVRQSARHSYYHHSSPSKPDGFTFFEKAVVRPELENAKAVIAGEAKGDKAEAQRILNLHGVYIDSRGKPQNGDKPPLISGRAVENYCTDVVVSDVSPADAFKNAINELHCFHGAEWRDADKDKRELEHKTTVRYGADGSIPKKDIIPTHTEFELVCSNALDGLREAFAGANRITGQKKIKGNIDDVQLPYLGYADYQEGGVELKTKWDTKAHTDKPSAGSLPKEITFPHLMQIAGYWHITGIWPTIVYANRLGYRVFKPELDQLHAGVAAIREACMRRERLLATANTTEELLKLCDPQWDHMFVWRDLPPEIIDRAQKIWRT
jgi:hypothetical protein